MKTKQVTVSALQEYIREAVRKKLSEAFGVKGDPTLGTFADGKSAPTPAPGGTYGDSVKKKAVEDAIKETVVGAIKEYYAGSSGGGEEYGGATEEGVDSLKAAPGSIRDPKTFSGQGGKDPNRDPKNFLNIPAQAPASTGSGQKPAMEEEKWMQGAVKKPGALHKQLGVPEGQPIPMSVLNAKKAELHKKSEGDKTLTADEAKLLQRIQFALTAKKVAKSTEEGMGKIGARYPAAAKGSELAQAKGQSPSTPTELALDDGGREDPDYTVEDWIKDVAAGKTKLGYWDRVEDFLGGEDSLSEAKKKGNLKNLAPPFSKKSKAKEETADVKKDKEKPTTPAKKKKTGEK